MLLFGARVYFLVVEEIQKHENTLEILRER